MRYRPRVRFRTATGEIVTISGQLSAASKRFEIGTQVPVVYRPAKPTEARIALFTDNWLGASLAAVIGLVGLAGGCWCGVRCAASSPRCRQAVAGMSTRFDREYYRRFYFDGRTAVTSRAEMRARARLIAAYADHIGLPVRRMLDAGCGIGLLRAPLQRAFPRARYTGLEFSEYLCQPLRLDAGLAGRLARRPVRSRGLLRRAAVPRRPHRGARHRRISAG